jgi:hypothetical protein
METLVDASECADATLNTAPTAARFSTVEPRLRCGYTLSRGTAATVREAVTIWTGRAPIGAGRWAVTATGRSSPPTMMMIASAFMICDRDDV